MKSFWKDLKEHATKIISYEKEEMISLTIEENNSYHEQKVCCICRKEFSADNKKYYKVRDHCHYTGKYRGAVHNVCNLRYITPKEIPAVFYNGSQYDHHFIIKELAEEFKGQFECLKKIPFQYQLRKDLKMVK